MKFPNTEFDESVLIEIAKKFNVNEIYVFGSILGNDFDEKSDVDILISFKDNINHSYFDLLELKENLSMVLNKPVDLIEKKSLINPYRRKEILATARMIYESN
jgi:hypothetical protein